MARIHPECAELESLPTPLNVGEHQVLECLSRLDDQWTIYVQPRLGLDQPDFVTVHRDFGICVIEVKDWAAGLYRQDSAGVVSYRSHDTWIPTTERPRHQANRYRNAIHNLLGALVDDAPSINSIRAAVVMPRLKHHDALALFATGKVNKEDDRVEVFGFDAAEAEPLLLLTGHRQPIRRRVSDDVIDALTRCLTEAESTSDQRAPLRLSPAAANIANNPSNAKIRRVRGAAGCGKSLGLAARAARLASEGKDVLVLSFNSTLPHYLRDLAARRCRELGAPLTQITFTHLHAICGRAAEDAKLSGVDPMTGFLPGTLSRFDELIERGVEAYRLGFGPRFDAVLVDEGQDFSLKWWNFLRLSVCQPDGELLLVADPTQDVYGQRAWTDEQRMTGAGFSGPWTELGGSYRLPPDYTPIVADFAQLVLGDWDENLTVPIDHPQNLVSFQPTIRRWINGQRSGAPGLLLGREVIEMLHGNPDLSPSDVVFLANSHAEGLVAAGVIASAGFEVRHVFGRTDLEKRNGKLRFWGNSGGVKGCTYQSFKGWESRAVVMSVGYGEQNHRNAYVGLTRVKGDRTNRRAFVTVVNNDWKLNSFQERFERAN
jgi:Nuclease-related domain